VLLLVVILYGITGYTVIERWNLLDAFYMTIITISTVGYMEIHPLSNAGEIFTSTLIVVGVGTMLYGFGVFAETLTDNSFVIYRRERQLERSLAGSALRSSPSSRSTTSPTPSSTRPRRRWFACATRTGCTLKATHRAKRS